MSYILAIDQGTSSCRTILFDKKFNIIGIEQKEFKQFYPKTSWVEQAPLEIWETQLEATKKVIKKHNISASEILGIGITNQRETTIIWNKNTGKPIYNAIVWQDKRTADFCKQLSETEHNNYIIESTGLRIDSYFSATKIKWILDNVENARQEAQNGNLLFGTVDTWLIWKLTGGEKHITDYSNASRTMLYNIKELKWDKKLLELFDIPENMMPQVVDSAGIAAYTSKEISDTKIPIAGIAGDQQAALFGQSCFKAGTAKNTYGTGGFILMNTGKKVFKSKHGLLSTIAWGIDGEIKYALEGSIFIAGAAVKWLRDSLKIIKTAAETQEICEKTDSTNGVYFVPAFSGLGAPFWNMEAKATISGLTLGSTANHIVRATIEAIAYRTKDVINAMYEDSQIKLQKLLVDGGVSTNDFLMQFQADILNTKVIRPKNTETTALGIAFMTAIGLGIYTLEDFHKMNTINNTFSPKIKQSKRDELYKGWQNALKNFI